MPRAAERLQLRRRLRRQLRMREALLLDLGALVYELHRQGKRAPALLQQKASELSAVDHEVRGLQDALRAGDGLDRLQATGVMGSCASCGALLGPGDDYCAHCGAAAWEEEAPAEDNTHVEDEAPAADDAPEWEEEASAEDDARAWDEDAPAAERAPAGDEAPAHDERPPS